MRKIGLTGGIGSGKSTVARMLVARGAQLIDADALSRAATQPGGAAIPSIRAAFGDAVVSTDGSLNRDAMREIMLTDARAKTSLEAILHPLIGEQINHRLEAANHAGAQLVVLDIPLLVEGGARWRSCCDAVWVVDCLASTQMARVQSRSAWPVAQVASVIAAQASRAQRLACADAVIFNEEITLSMLDQLVVACLDSLKLRCQP